LNKRNKLRLLLIFIIIGFVISPAFADETTINLDSNTPYIDIPIQATEPTTITIQTTNGTPQTNPSFIDSWIELWQDVNKLRADDDGAHSGTNVLASFITTPIDAGIYFIRATSFAWMASNQTQLPTGSYVLTWSGVATIPTPTPTPTPTETITPTPEPTSLPSDTPSATPSETPTPEETISSLPVIPYEPPAPNDNLSNVELTPTPEPSDTNFETNLIQDIQQIEPIQELVEEELQDIPIDTPLVTENITPQIELQVPEFFANILGAEQVMQTLENVLSVGLDMTPEEREESQAVVISAVLLQQISTSIVRRIK
jgi:hypothetical protein